MELSHFPGPGFRLDGSEFSYFGGTDYLGMAQHPGYISILKENLQKYGAAYGASRVSNVRLEIFDQVELQIAELCGAEDAVLLSSGYLAGQLPQYLFKSKEYAPLAMEGTHSSLLSKNVRLVASVSEMQEAIGESA